jgi:hypothetical protein
MRKTIKMLSLMLALLFTTTMSFGQQSSGTIQKDTASIELKEVVVVGGTNYQVQQVIKNPKVYLNSARIQETSPGQLSPYVGAFTGNQVDQSINGIRVNNGLFRTGPNQYFGWVPLEFTKLISITDGGNIGGTIERKVGVQSSHVGLNYVGGTDGFSQSASYKGKKFGIGFNNIDYGNVISPDSTFQHSAYNQKALVSEANWSSTQKTTLIFSQSNDLERTDRWNGGFRSSGYQRPAVYTWELQRYLFVNHEMNLNRLRVNLAYQNSAEDILDGTKKVASRLEAYTANLEYQLPHSFSIYSTNTIEKIRYENGLVGGVSNDDYKTTKHGIRWINEIGKVKVYTSLGLKNVQITDIDPFNGFEYSAIVGYKGLFASYDNSLNAPSYLMIKQAMTNGRGTQLPNPDLIQERGQTYRFGYKRSNLYLDVYFKELDEAFNVTVLSTNVFRTDNIGGVSVNGATLGYFNDSLFGTKLGVNARAEYVYGVKRLTGTTTEPVDKTVPYFGYIKLNYNKLWVEGRYQPIDQSLSFADRNDVRQFLHNKGVRLVNIGYTTKYKNLEYTMLFYNLFNDASRVWGSSVDLPTRSINLNLKYNF